MKSLTKNLWSYLATCLETVLSVVPLIHLPLLAVAWGWEKNFSKVEDMTILLGRAKPLINPDALNSCHLFGLLWSASVDVFCSVPVAVQGLNYSGFFFPAPFFTSLSKIFLWGIVTVPGESTPSADPSTLPLLSYSSVLQWAILTL